MSATFEDEAVEVPEWAMDRARLGATWLDSKFGPDWDSKIDSERLDIGSPRNCILGQFICRGHLSLLFMTEAVECGFSLGGWDLVVLFLPIKPVKRAYRPLTDAWKCILRERRGETLAQTGRSTVTLPHDADGPQRNTSKHAASIAASSRHASA